MFNNRWNFLQDAAAAFEVPLDAGWAEPVVRPSSYVQASNSWRAWRLRVEPMASPHASDHRGASRANWACSLSVCRITSCHVLLPHPDSFCSSHSHALVLLTLDQALHSSLAPSQTTLRCLMLVGMRRPTGTSTPV